MSFIEHISTFANTSAYSTWIFSLSTLIYLITIFTLKSIASINARSKPALPNMRRNHPPSPGNGQNATPRPGVPINLVQTETQAAPNPVQGQLRAQNEDLSAQSSVLLNEFLTKTRPLVASELHRNDMHCTICSELFLRGENPEVPVKLLNCGHVFGMSCILKWLSPVSRDGRNSCPNCRSPVFDHWDAMNYPVTPQVATDGRRNVTAAVPVRDPNVNLIVNRADLIFDRAGRTSARVLPAGFPREIRARRAAPAVATAEPVDATAATGSVTASPRAVAPNAPSPPPPSPPPPPGVVTQEASDQQQAVQRPQARVTNGTRTLEVSTTGETTSSLPTSIQPHARGVASTTSRREQESATAGLSALDVALTRFTTEARSGSIRNQPMELALRLTGARTQFTDARRLEEFRRRFERDLEARSIAQEAAHRPAVAATPAPAETARPADNEDNGVAATFHAAEEGQNRQHQEEVTKERKRRMWMQFCEGVVRSIEQSNDSTALANHDLALTIVNMKDLDGFAAERAAQSPVWCRILQTFPRLHTETVTRFDDFGPLASVNIDHRIELERLFASARFNTDILNRSRWYMRLTERIAEPSGPSRDTAASAIRSVGPPPTQEEAAREVRRMEEYLLEAAASVDAALPAGAESNVAMTRVTRL